MTDLTADIAANENRPSISKDGHVYRNQLEYMKYYMRRVRQSDLPHYPEHEPKGGN